MDVQPVIGGATNHAEPGKVGVVPVDDESGAGVYGVGPDLLGTFCMDGIRHAQKKLQA